MGLAEKDVISNRLSSFNSFLMELSDGYIHGNFCQDELSFYEYCMLYIKKHEVDKR